MTLVNLFPVGALQMADSVQMGYWHAREPGFFAQPAVRTLEWLRLPGDVCFIVVGILPMVYLAVRMFLNRKRNITAPAGRQEEAFTQFYEEPPA